MQKIIALVSILALLFLSACSGGSNNNITPNPTDEEQNENPPVIDESRAIHTNIVSSLTGIDYPLHIYLPPDYENSQLNYPVIYATDGQWVFEGFGEIIDQHEQEFLLVAIEQGPNDRRATDYLMPGAELYFEFIRTELLPLIENAYRVDTANRNFLGTSYGGVIAGLALLMDDSENPLFKNYLSFDPSFQQHPSTTIAMEEARYNASNNLNATLFITSAIPFGNNPHVNWYISLLQDRDYQGLTIYKRSYSVAHEDVASPSFRSALETLY